MIVVNATTRQFNIPGSEMTFGVTADSGSEVKQFQCPRYVGNNVDLMGSFLRINYRNANGEIDFHLIEDVAVDGDNVTFSWQLDPKVTQYKGQVKFVLCVTGADLRVKWHTTLGTGLVLEGLEPDSTLVLEGTEDGIAQLLAMVDAQTAAVEKVGGEQMAAVRAAAEAAQAAAVAEVEAKGVNTRESIPEDYTAMQEALESLVRGKAPGIVCEVEGSAVVVNDASDNFLQGLRIYGRSTQDGTPTPDTPVEIKSVVEPVVTVAGRNLCSESELDKMGINGTASTYDSATRTITMNTNPTGFAGHYGAPFKKMVVGKDYTVSFSVRGTPGKIVKCGWDKQGVTITLTDTFARYSATLKATRANEPIVFYTRATEHGGLAAGEYMQFADVQIEPGSEATAYEPYKPTQTVNLTHTLHGIPVTSGGNYTDSDGQQWICDEVDLERGVYVQRFKVVTLTGDENWVQDTNYECTYRVGAGHIAVGGVSTHYHTYVRTEDIGSVSGVYLAYTVNHIITDPRFVNDLAGFKAFLVNEYSSGKPVTVIRRLAEPIETPLSETEIAAYRALHSNYPNTTVLNDAGAHMVVKYAADTKLYIDNKIAALVGG